jgi:hypothetical protein
MVHIYLFCGRAIRSWLMSGHSFRLFFVLYTGTFVNTFMQYIHLSHSLSSTLFFRIAVRLVESLHQVCLLFFTQLYFSRALCDILEIVLFFTL